MSANPTPVTGRADLPTAGEKREPPQPTIDEVRAEACRIAAAAHPALLEELAAHPLPSADEPPLTDWLAEIPFPPADPTPLVERIEAWLRPHRPTPRMWLDPMPKTDPAILPDGEEGVLAAFEAGFREAAMLLKGARTDGSLARAVAAEEPVPGGSPNGAASAPGYVTLDQIAALMNRSKKTLERYLNAPKSTMPRPDVEGGGGRPHEWLWRRIRPWLQDKFGRRLPDQFPSLR